MRVERSIFHPHHLRKVRALSAGTGAPHPLPEAPGAAPYKAQPTPLRDPGPQGSR